MRRYEDDCCDCVSDGRACLGSLCPRRQVLHIYCDGCIEEATPMYAYEGKDYCADCLIAELLEWEVIDEVEI